MAFFEMGGGTHNQKLELEKNIKISLIIPIYKKKEFIEAVLESINYQTYKNFEVMVTEDDNTLGDFIKNLRSKLNYKLIHVQQEDLGYRRNTALNNGVKNSSGNLIVVIDQDCMLHPKFLEEYAKNFNNGDMFVGRRFNLGKKYTEVVLKNKIRKFNFLRLIFTDCRIKEIARGAYLPWLKVKRTTRCLGSNFGIKRELIRKFNFLRLIFTDCRIKEIARGAYLPWLKVKRTTRCLGSNFGIKRELLLKLNGFDENYIGYGLEDVDIEKRVLMAGGKIFSMKNKAIQYHLYHPEPQGNLERYHLNRAVLDKTIETKQYICKNGLKKL